MCPSELPADKSWASAENPQIMHNACLFFDTYQDLLSTGKLMVHFNIPSLWKAEDLSHLCLRQGSHVPHRNTATAIKPQLW